MKQKQQIIDTIYDERENHSPYRRFTPLYLLLFVLPFIFVYLFITLPLTNPLFYLVLLVALEFCTWIFDF